MSNRNLLDLTINDIILACRQEAQQHRKQEMGYCFELFRRALDEGDEAAWTALQEQYVGLIRGWLYGAAANSIPSQTIDELVQETLTRFWRTLSRQAEGLVERFDHVGGLLNYLQRCAVASYLDWQRQNRRQNKLQEELALAHSESAGSVVTILEQMERKELVQRIKNWIQAEIHDEQERMILYLSYEQGLKPDAIAQHYPEQFATAQEVRRIKERVLKRARRSLAF